MKEKGTEKFGEINLRKFSLKIS